MQLILLHLLLVPIIIVGSRAAIKTEIKLIHFLSLITLILVIIKRDSALITIIPVYYLAGLLTNKFKVVEEKNKEMIKETLKEAKTQYQELVSHKNTIEEKNKNIEENIEEISELYEVTKDLNETLDFKKTLDIIADSINGIFRFTCARIILVDENKLISGVKNVNHVKSASSDFIPASSNGARAAAVSFRRPSDGKKIAAEVKEDIKKLDSDPLVRYALTSLMPLSLNEDEVKRRVSTPADIKSFTSVPLIVANELLGIITMTNAELKHTEEDLLSLLCILSAQYAIEISKAKLYEKLQSLAITDGLTRISRRHHFLERYNEEISRSKRHKHNLTILMIDIDHFKNFNERYGHLYGDAVLREVARLLKQGIREVDLVCRYGGEEFTIMLPETNKSQAKIVAERLRQSIAEDRFQAYGETATLTISIGVASLPEDAIKGEELIDKADEALLRAKREGRNRVCLY